MTQPNLHPNWIDHHAVRIIETLKRNGFDAYLVGGCVRDLLIGLHPKDYDIATNASPEQIRRCINHSYIIGRRFRLVLVKRGSQQYEVATFRRNGPVEDPIESPSNAENQETPSKSSNPPQNQKDSFNTEKLSESVPNLISGDNYYGTIEEDARRRDFTVNALFYDPIDNEIIDYCNGQSDIQNHILRMIGDPVERFKEDSIRIFRAIRLAHKLHFQLDPVMRSAIQSTAPELARSVLPRRREEYLKLLRLKHPEQAFLELLDLGIWSIVAPQFHSFLENVEQRNLFFQMLSRIHQTEIDLHTAPELIAAFLYCYVKTVHEIKGLECKDVLESSTLFELAKNELGFFKLEFSQLGRCLELIDAFKNVETYKRKGLRRQNAFLTNDLLNLSLSLGQLDYSIHPKDLHFWLSELKKTKQNP